MPQYHVGHRERLGRIEALLAGLPGIELAGAAYEGVGIPDCITSATARARRLASSLA
jgi:oxygen-dependent protoporphyrinogen oxidase